MAFSYKAVAIDGVQVGVIRIELQERPTFLKKDYGRLKGGTVYIRRGSSTDTADPSEVHRMGVASVREERLLEKPVLEPKLASLMYVNVMRHVNSWLFVELRLNFVIVNSGRAASLKWKLVVEEIDGHDSSRLDDYKIGKEAFPDGASSRDGIRIDGPILPSLSYRADVPLGVYLRPEVWDAEHLTAEFERMLPPTLSLGFRAVSETSSGQKVTSSVEPVFDRKDTLRRILERV